MEVVTYPQFRKYPNGSAYFKILSEKEWEEIRKLGKNYTIERFTVKILPDRNYLHDLTFDFEQYYVLSNEAEYETVKKLIVPSQ